MKKIKANQLPFSVRVGLSGTGSGAAGTPGTPGATGATGSTGATGGPPTKTDVSSSSTWIITHGLSRVPAVQVFLTGGEFVTTDVTATTTTVTVTFASPQSGFVLLS